MKSARINNRCKSTPLSLIPQGRAGAGANEADGAAELEIAEPAIVDPAIATSGVREEERRGEDFRRVDARLDVGPFFPQEPALPRDKESFDSKASNVVAPESSAAAKAILAQAIESSRAS